MKKALKIYISVDMEGMAKFIIGKVRSASVRVRNGDFPNLLISGRSMNSFDDPAYLIV